LEIGMPDARPDSRPDARSATTSPAVHDVPIARWILRIAAVTTGATVPLLDDRLDAVSSGAAVLSSIAMWALWGVVLLCVLVPSAVSLTALRLVAPAHLSITAILVVGAVTDDASTVTVLAIVPVLVTTVVAMTADIGSNFVQSSAYGDEFRVLLLPGRAFLVVLIASWVIWVASLVVGALALTREAWVAGGILVAFGVTLTAVLPRRFHRFARRWLVVVPAGLVLHDHVVLAETAMFQRTAITSVTVVARDDEVADLSGRSRGPGLRVELLDFDTVVLAATPNQPGGSALHVKSWWVRPSRPGRLTSEWTRPRARSTS
jgi:hypothetical protein